MPPTLPTTEPVEVIYPGRFAGLEGFIPAPIIFFAAFLGKLWPGTEEEDSRHHNSLQSLLYWIALDILIPNDLTHLTVSQILFFLFRVQAVSPERRGEQMCWVLRSLRLAFPPPKAVRDILYDPDLLVLPLPEELAQCHFWSFLDDRFDMKFVLNSIIDQPVILEIHRKDPETFRAGGRCFPDYAEYLPRTQTSMMPRAIRDALKDETKAGYQAFIHGLSLNDLLEEKRWSSSSTTRFNNQLDKDLAECKQHYEAFARERLRAEDSVVVWLRTVPGNEGGL